MPIELPPDVAPEVQQLIDDLHSEGWVDGDLRKRKKGWQQRVMCTKCDHHYFWLTIDPDHPDRYAADQRRLLWSRTCI